LGEVIDRDELFPRQCRKARLRGLAFCETHRDTPQLAAIVAKVPDSYTDEVDAAAVALIPVLNRLAQL
jgi:hypothetical protein